MNAHVLLVDDYKPFLSMVEDEAKSLGVAIDVAATWDDGLAAFRAGAYELVIADYNLPGSDHGLQLLGAIRGLRPTVRLILISAYVTPERQGAIEASGWADRFLIKSGPFLDEMLKEMVAAKERADEPTDWVALSRAVRSSIDVDREDVIALDEELRRTLPPGSV